MIAAVNVEANPLSKLGGEIIAADAPYWQGLAAGRLLLPRCADCGKWFWPAAHYCPHCHGEAVEWLPRPMQARIFAWTRTWHRFQYTESLPSPFMSIVAEVADCGIRLLGRLEDARQGDPVIGEAVRGHIGHTIIGERSLPTIIWSRNS